MLVRKKIPDKYKYLFESPKPFSKCNFEEKAVYAYFNHKAEQEESICHFVVCILIGVVITVAIVIVALLIRAVLL